MSETVKNKRITVATTVDFHVFNALEDYRWSAHLKMSELVAKALDEFMDTHGIITVDDPKV